MDNLNEKLTQWQAAGLLDGETAARISAYEQSEAHPEGERWQIRIALIFGAVLSSAGILLFVAAHWDGLGTAARLCLVLGTLALLHLGGSLVREHFDGLATTLHGIGTVCLGAAIALVGQIFNMQSHWPTAILLWAFGAGVGWWLLRDNTQQILAILLAPTWFVCELVERTGPYDGSNVYLARLVLVLAAVYLVCFENGTAAAVTNWMFAIATLAIPFCIAILSDGWTQSYSLYPWGFVPTGWRIVTAVAVILLLAGCWRWSRKSIPVVLGAAFLGYVLPWLTRPQLQVSDVIEGMVVRRPVWQPSIFTYLLLALTSAALAWWGVRQRDGPVVNYAILGFGAVVIWFYFSSLMDKMDRSLSLIGLGIVFLAGGYALDRLRRRLLLHMQNPEAQA